jgi:CRP-like cAMP-binding protein
MTKSNTCRKLEESTFPASSFRLFSGLTPEQRKRVIESAQPRKFRPNHVIIRADEPATHFYLLLEGRVKYYRVTKKGEEVVLGWLVHGDTFGAGALLKDSTCNVGNAQTIGACELLVWSQEQIRNLAATYRRLTENALHVALYYLSLYTEKVIGLTTQTAKQRLAHSIIRLCRRTGDVRPSGVELEITNEDLGALANVSVYTVSRQLKEWSRAGIIEKRRGKINILSPESLLAS